MNVIGIKCDKDGCGYRDDSVVSSDFEKYIDSPCPRCSSSLLTLKDYQSFKKIEKIMNSRVIKLINWISYKMGAKSRTYSVDMNGTGSVSIKQKND